MAQRVVTTLVSDISGKELGEGGQTLTFALDGVSYEIDLSAKEADSMREALRPYVDAGRRTGGRRATTRRAAGARTDPAQLAAIREWAKGQGMEVSERGRISQAVKDAYEDAHKR